MGPTSKVAQLLPTRYRDLVLTSWDRGMSDGVPFLHTSSSFVDVRVRPQKQGGRAARGPREELEWDGMPPDAKISLQ